MADKKVKKKQETKAKKGSFFVNLLAELKRVNWPDRKKLLHSLAAVCIISVSFALLIWVVDSLVYGGLNLIGFHEVNQTIAETQANPAVAPTVAPQPSSTAVAGK